MRPLIRWLGGLCAALVIAAPAARAGEIARLGPDPVLGGGVYSTGGGITVAVEMRNIGGRTGLCGVWAQSEQLTVYVRRSARRVLSKGSIALDGRILTNNLDFLRRVAPSPGYAGAPAGCVRLDRPWQPGDAARRPEVWIPRQMVHVGQGGEDKGGPRISFRDKGHPNPALEAGSLLPAHWTTGGHWQGQLDD